MKYIKHIISNKLKVRNLFIAIIPLLTFIIMSPRQANAFNPVAWIADQTIGFAAANFVGMFKGLFLMLLNTVVSLLTNVMSYQNFFSNGVNAGWEITRNFSNLFFALILLVIAIATVLQIGALDNYTAKRMLPNFIFVALFINFSKAIVGLLIDISQIIMVSFYNSFGPNMANIIGNASRIAETGAETNTETMMLNIFTIVIIAILVFVLLWTALILAMRIVNLWFIIMLAPLAFMATLIPGLKSVSDDWKNKLQESLVTGPTLMFFLYLAFSLMSVGISANTATTGGDNLINNGNLINYVLVIGLLFLANTTASKAGQAAPPILQKAVGVAGTIATFGLGAYVGAGGYNTNQLRKKTIELGDKGIGGVTNITGQNARYEAAKKDFRERQASGTGMFGEKKVKVLGREINVNPLRLTRGLSDEGKKNIQQEYDIEYAKKLANEGKIDAPANERYKKIFNAERVRETKELEESGLGLVDLRTKLYKAIQENDLLVAQSTLLQIDKIGELGNISQNHAGVSQQENDYFARIAQENETEGAILDAIVSDLEPDNENASKSSLYRNFRTNLKRVGSDKKGQSFVSNIETSLSDTTTLTPTQQQNLNNMSPQDIKRANAQNNANNAVKKVIGSGLKNGIENINNNPNVMRKRSVDPNNPNLFATDQNTGKPIFEPNSDKIFEFIRSENSLTVLRDPQTWSKLKQQSKDDFITVLRGPAPANTTLSDSAKYQAALQGLTN